MPVLASAAEAPADARRAGRRSADAGRPVRRGRRRCAAGSGRCGRRGGRPGFVAAARRQLHPDQRRDRDQPAGLRLPDRLASPAQRGRPAVPGLGLRAPAQRSRDDADARRRRRVAGRRDPDPGHRRQRGLAGRAGAAVPDRPPALPRRTAAVAALATVLWLLVVSRQLPADHRDPVGRFAAGRRPPLHLDHLGRAGASGLGQRGDGDRHAGRVVAGHRLSGLALLPRWRPGATPAAVVAHGRGGRPGDQHPAGAHRRGADPAAAQHRHGPGGDRHRHRPLPAARHPVGAVADPALRPGHRAGDRRRTRASSRRCRWWCRGRPSAACRSSPPSSWPSRSTPSGC